MRRISVVGSSGSGKTTTARSIAERLGYPLLELDSIFHLPDWTPLPDAEFRAAAAEFASRPNWVIDGNYTSHGVQNEVWERADTVVWVDLSKPRVMGRVVRRTMKRAATREELWNGNREPWSNFTKWTPEENIIRWAWTRFDMTRDKYDAKMNDPANGHLRFFRLRSPREVDGFLRDLTPEA